MKKFILALAALIISTGCSFAQKYRGFVDVEGGYVRPNGLIRFDGKIAVGISTSHGVQLNKVFVGAGLSYNSLAAYTSLPKMSVFADARYDFFGHKSTNFFIDCKLGSFLLNSLHLTELIPSKDPNHYDKRNAVDGTTSLLFFKPSVGVRFRLSSLVGINLALYYIPMKVKHGSYEKYDGGDNWIEYPAKSSFVNTFGLSVGLDF